MAQIIAKDTADFETKFNSLARDHFLYIVNIIISRINNLIAWICLQDAIKSSLGMLAINSESNKKYVIKELETMKLKICRAESISPQEFPDTEEIIKYILLPSTNMTKFLNLKRKVLNDLKDRVKVLYGLTSKAKNIEFQNNSASNIKYNTEAKNNPFADYTGLDKIISVELLDDFKNRFNHLTQESGGILTVRECAAYMSENCISSKDNLELIWDVVFKNSGNANPSNVKNEDFIYLCILDVMAKNELK